MTAINFRILVKIYLKMLFLIEMKKVVDYTLVRFLIVTEANLEVKVFI